MYLCVIELPLAQLAVVYEAQGCGLLDSGEESILSKCGL